MRRGKEDQVCPPASFYFTFEWKVDSGGTGAKKLDHCYHCQVFSQLGSSIPTLGDEWVRE